MRRPPRSTRAYTLFPYPTLFLSRRRVHDLSRAVDDRRAVQRLFRQARPARQSVCGPRQHRTDDQVQLLKTCAETLARTIVGARHRSEEHTSELPSLMRISYAAFCWQKKKNSHKTR